MTRRNEEVRARQMSDERPLKIALVIVRASIFLGKATRVECVEDIELGKQL